MILKNLWVLSRSPRMDDAAYDQLVEEGRAQGFDVSRLQNGPISMPAASIKSTLALSKLVSPIECKRSDVDQVKLEGGMEELWRRS